MSIVKINLEDLIIFEGKAKATGKAYKFVKIDRRLSNNSTFVDQLKAAGVRINAAKADVEAPTAIIE